MPAKRPTAPRPFAHLLSDSVAVALLASLPLGQPGKSAPQLAEAVRESCGTTMKERQIRDLIDRCRIYGAQISGDRRQPRRSGAIHTLYHWEPTADQLREVEQADALLLA